MGVNTKAELTTKEQVKKFYELHSNKIMFVIYAGVSMKHEYICFDYLDNDQPEEASEKLDQFLTLIQEREDNNNVYTIQLVDSYKEIDTKAGMIRNFTGRSMRFQLNPNKPYPGANSNTPIVIKNNIPGMEGQSNDVVELLKQMLSEEKEKTRLLVDKMEALERNFYNQEEEEEEDEEEQEPEPVQKTIQERAIGAIMGIAERDEVQEALAGLIVNGQKWLNKKVFKIGNDEQ